MDFSHYLPDTEKRIERLRSLVNKRSVVILLPGGSIAELEDRIEELRGYDICYWGINESTRVEKALLGKIGQQYSVVMNSAGPVHQMDSIIPFFERQGNNLLISEKNSFMREWFDYEGFIKQYDEKLLFFQAERYEKDNLIPNREYPLHFHAQSSFSILLSLAVIGQATKVFFWGGDGGKIEDFDLYFSGYKVSSEGALVQDANRFNETMPLIMERVYELYELSPVDIFNCSINSHYTPFQRISCDEGFTILRGNNGN